MFEKQRFLSIANQKIINRLYYLKVIYFKNQFVYKDRQAFKNCMNFLCRNNIAKENQIILSEGQIVNAYKLTFAGTVFFEEYLRGLE